MVHPIRVADAETSLRLVRLMRSVGLVCLVFAPVIGAVFWIAVRPLVGVLMGALFACVCLYMIVGFKPVSDWLRRRSPT